MKGNVQGKMSPKEKKNLLDEETIILKTDYSWSKVWKKTLHSTCWHSLALTMQMFTSIKKNPNSIMHKNTACSWTSLRQAGHWPTGQRSAFQVACMAFQLLQTPQMHTNRKGTAHRDSWKPAEKKKKRNPYLIEAQRMQDHACTHKKGMCPLYQHSPQGHTQQECIHYTSTHHRVIHKRNVSTIPAHNTESYTKGLQENMRLGSIHWVSNPCMHALGMCVFVFLVLKVPLEGHTKTLSWMTIFRSTSSTQQVQRGDKLEKIPPPQKWRQNLFLASC